jgi:hypothetical protein
MDGNLVSWIDRSDAKSGETDARVGAEIQL